MDNGASSYSRYLEGDDSALTEIIRIYKDGLTLYLNSFTNNIHDAEEIMEETFYRLAYKKPKYKPKSSFKTWLYTIGRNIAIDYIRKQNRYRTASIDDCAEISSVEDIEEYFCREEQSIAVHKAVNKLKTEYRQVIYLIYFEDFTNTETAAIMRKTSRQITNLLYQAKKALKTELEKEEITYAGL